MNQAPPTGRTRLRPQDETDRFYASPYRGHAAVACRMSRGELSHCPLYIMSTWIPKLMVHHMWWRSWHSWIHGTFLCICSLGKKHPPRRKKLQHERQESKRQKHIKEWRSLGDHCSALLYKLFSELRPGFSLHLPWDWIIWWKADVSI